MLMRRFCQVAATWLLLLAANGCARDDGSRDKAQAEFTQQLVDAGLQPDQAACIVEAFFDGRSNDQLNEFFERAELTNDERAELAAITRECAPDRSVP